MRSMVDWPMPVSYLAEVLGLHHAQVIACAE
jgi:hypothetical protein